MATLLFLALAFLSGSIPFGYVLGRARGLDIRQHGSKNVGATNVGRVLGRPWGFLCFGLDFLKGFVPTLGYGLYEGVVGSPRVEPGVLWPWLAVMTACVLGHIFSPWLGFKGGKGVATGFGALAGVWPIMGAPVLVAFLVWLIVLKTTRYVGLASIVAAACLPVGVLALVPAAKALGWHDGPQAIAWPAVIVGGLLATLVVWKHRGNIARMRAGTEPKVGRKGENAPSA
ncbi:MAG: glycerol-3-phosphate 1-O-acyltransferase PlsY [Phycisphaerales bacterium]